MTGSLCHFALPLRAINALLNPGIFLFAGRHQITKKRNSGDPSRILYFLSLSISPGTMLVLLAEMVFSRIEGSISLNQHPRNVLEMVGKPSST